jgi:cation/acetate symporter
MVLNFIVTLVVSRFTPPPPAEVQAMVEELRTPEDVPSALADIGEEQLQ